MKERYLNLMERALGAYSYEQMVEYLEDVKANGVKEHGFPRLTSNIGILMAHGARRDLLPLFLEMMDVCCHEALAPYTKKGNEFTIRELIFCIDEVETAGIVPAERIAQWKEKLSQLVPEKGYHVVVHSETDLIANWAIFGAVSEYARCLYGLNGSLEFVDRQLSCQFQWLDENGMYKDDMTAPCHHPMAYDLVGRGLFAMLLHYGYRGKYYEIMDETIKKAALLTLKMQSPNGEVPFGGRSNQFVNNESWLAFIFEFEALRYAKEGNMELAGKFKAAAHRALCVIEEWLNKDPIRHIKNRYPTETKYGCEPYGHFRKYMITTASFLYCAYRICDDSIPTASAADVEPAVFQTSEYFHKLFVKSGGYGLEFDFNGDPIYDANGLGRVHKVGAPNTICMSSPCAQKPRFPIDLEDPFAFSLCSAVPTEDGWRFGAEEGTKYEVLETATGVDCAWATLNCRFADGRSVLEKYNVNKDGVSIAIASEGRIGFALPAFSFDGETAPNIVAEENTLTVSYQGWICRYTTNGTVVDLGKTAANRNGHYRAFMATGEDTLNITITITEE